MSSALARLRKLLLTGELRFDDATRRKYGGDKWYAFHTPDAVALPRTTKSVAKLLQYASRNRIPVTARGAGYGYVGSCVPNKGGIVLSLERMTKIKEINSRDFVAVVEAGVITQT